MRADYRPLIGLTANYDGGQAMLSEGYYKSVVLAGGVPVVLPPVKDEAVAARTLDGLDALVLTGGGDYNPLLCGEEPSPRLHSINPERDAAELLLTRLAHRRNMPMLGICRGLQTLAMALGGHVVQDIDEGHTPPAGVPRVKHSQDAPRTEATHTVIFTDGSLLHRLYATGRMTVNSLHHQAVDDGGQLFTITARAADGVAEAMESAEHKAIVGVQWHPEWLAGGDRLFRWLTDEARLYGAARRLHADMVTLDSHCDTPMLFPRGVDIGRRDSGALVDVPKMDDGMLDAVTMVAYLPQPPQGQTFADVAPRITGRDADTPRAYADTIFDMIESQVNACSHRVALARTPADIWRNKAQAVRSVVLGIENGIALEHDLSNIDHFARRGVSYITLCHNGDNDICDSARGRATHGGVSPFGATVIRRMNSRGIMVDMSHAAESSFYDALQISRMPIVCSHSCCRALCDNPRNLTDDQLRALARSGGLAQMTLYGGFLNSRAAEADIDDLLNHLNHAVDVMGIERVGIGTDLDGDGGVPGFADASDALNLTMHLLRRRYAEADIRQLWGGNWLRVMNEVQGGAQQG